MVVEEEDEEKSKKEVEAVGEEPKYPHLSSTDLLRASLLCGADKYIMAVDDAQDAQEDIVRAVAEEILGLGRDEPITYVAPVS